MNVRGIGWWLGWIGGGTAAFLVAFFASFLLVGGVVSLAVEDVDTVMGTPLGFLVGLTVAFTLAGAALGCAQMALVRRHVPRAGGWVLGTAAGFAAVALLHTSFVALVGEATAEAFLPRLANEIGHNLVAGLVAGWLQVRLVFARADVPARAWPLWSAAAFVAAGHVAWAVESALAWEAGDAAPLGILAFTLVTAIGWRRTVAPREPAPAAPTEPEAAGAP